MAKQNKSTYGNNPTNAGPAKVGRSGKAGPGGGKSPSGMVTPFGTGRGGKKLGGSSKVSGQTGPTNSPQGTNHLKKK